MFIHTLSQSGLAPQTVFRLHACGVGRPWHGPSVVALLALLLLPCAAFAQNSAGTSMSGGTSGGASASGGASTQTSGAASSGTLRAVGTTVNGKPAGTSGTDPGVPSSQPSAPGPSAATSGTTLRPVGINVDGSVAGTSGTDPGSQTLSSPLNRNPANRATVPDAAPPADPGNSLSRPTQGAVTRPDGRDTVVTPDPSRDSLTR